MRSRQRNSPLASLITPGAFSIGVSVVLLLLLLSSYFLGHFEASDNNIYLCNLLNNMLSAFPLISFIAGFVALIILAFALFQFVETFSIIRVQTMMPVILFLLLLLSFSFKIEIYSNLLACPFLLLSLWTFVSSHQEREPAGKIFDAFFFLSAGSLFAFDLLAFVPMFWIGLFLFKVNSFRIFLASLIGLITPYVIYLSVLFALGKLPEFVLSVQRQLTFSISGLGSVHFVYILFLVIFHIISFIYFVTHSYDEKIKARQILQFLYLLALPIFVISFFKPDSFDNLPLLALNASVLLGHYFSISNSRFVFVMFAVFVVGCLSFCLI